MSLTVECKQGEGDLTATVTSDSEKNCKSRLKLVSGIVMKYIGHIFIQNIHLLKILIHFREGNSEHMKKPVVITLAE